jgi:hypothetical protein
MPASRWRVTSALLVVFAALTVASGSRSAADDGAYSVSWDAAGLRDPGSDLLITHKLHGKNKPMEVGRLLFKGVNRRKQAPGFSARLAPRVELSGNPKRPPDGRIRPPGWEDDRGYTRLMLLPYTMGGNGHDARNLVTVHRATVAPRFATIMSRIHHAIKKDGKTVEFRVTPVYRDAGKPGSLIIKADIPLEGDKYEVTIANEAPPPLVGPEFTERGVLPQITHLKRIMPPPRKPVSTGTPAQWQAVEKRLTLTLPEDYKQFVGTYGAGSINGHIFIANPFSERDWDNLVERVRSKAAALRHWKQEHPKDIPYDVWPTPGGLLPLGSTDVGDNLFWRTRGKPDAWTIVLSSRGGDGWVELDCGLAAFLRRMFQEDIQVGFWPPEWLRPAFRQHTDEE